MVEFHIIARNNVGNSNSLVKYRNTMLITRHIASNLTQMKDNHIHKSNQIVLPL